MGFPLPEDRAPPTSEPEGSHQLPCARCSVADFHTSLDRSDIESYLRQAAGSEAGNCLLGDAEMRVNSNGKTEFSRKDLRLELGGRTTLSGEFKAVQHTSIRQPPKVGRR